MVGAGERPRVEGGARIGAIERFRRVLKNSDLRRILSALAAVVVGGSAYQVALLVVAFAEGGAAAAGIALALQAIPVALLAPVVSIAADRFDRRRVMVAIDLFRCACTAAVAAAVAADASLALILVLGAPGAIVSAAYAPASRALLPSIVNDPEELTAANAALSGVEHAGLLVGPALVGLLLVIAEPSAVFALGSVMFLVSALMVLGVQGDARAPEEQRVWGKWRVEASAGLRTVASEPVLRLLVGAYAAIMFVAGALQVFAVVLANELTGLGDSGVGALYSALGAGGIAGTIIAISLADRGRVGDLLMLGVAIIGLPLIAIGLFPNSATALGGVALIGTATVVADVAVITLLQRAVSNEVLGRVFGVLESVLCAMVGLGSLAVPLLIGAFGNRGALIAAGAALVLLVGSIWPRLRRLGLPSDDVRARVALLRDTEIFAPLTLPVVESLAYKLEPLSIAEGEVVVGQGDPGDRFYVVREGTLEAAVDDRVVATLGAGESFGEIALLRQGPRTATVTARDAAKLYALDRNHFLAAITAHPLSAAAGEAVAAGRLARAQPGSLIAMS